MKFLAIDDTNLAYEERGAGPSILLVHGFPLDSRIWIPVQQRLADRFRVVRLDLRGFGQSALGKGFTLQTLADDVATFADATKLGQYLLAGLSMGGYLSLAYAAKYESTLAGLALVDSKAAADTDEQKNGRDNMIQLVRTSGSKAVADEMLGKMLSEQTIRQSPQTVRELRSIMEACPAKTIETALTAMRDRPDYQSLLPRLNVPFHVIVGESDAITPPAIAEKIVAAAPGAGLTVVPGAGHMSPMEQPDAVAAALRAFADRCFKPE